MREPRRDGSEAYADPAPRWRARDRWLLLLVVALAALTRFTGIGLPHDVVFDETYYAKDAYAMWHTGVEREWTSGANAEILRGDLGGLQSNAAFTSHPPLGKWIIGAGEAVFGMNPTGWRVPVALCGTIAAGCMYLAGRRLTRSTLGATVAGLCFALDGVGIVLGRHALLDGILAMWLAAATWCLAVDLDADPRRLWRPARLAMAVCLGAACATKWSGIWVVAGFGLVAVGWQAGRVYRSRGSRAVVDIALRHTPLAALQVVGLAAVTYVVTWWGWLTTPDGWDRTWGLTHPPATGLSGLVPTAMRSLWHYHDAILNSMVTLSTPHAWASPAWKWLLQGRPVLFYATYPGHGQEGCTAASCVRYTLALGVPLLWWGGIVLCGWGLWRAVRRADAWAVIALVGVITTYGVWFLFPDRTIFATYLAATLPYIGLLWAGFAVTLWREVRPRTGWGAPAGILGGLAVLGLWQVVYFWPIWTATLISNDAWNARMWLPGWH